MFNELERECIIESLKQRIANCARTAEILKNEKVKHDLGDVNYWLEERNVAEDTLTKIRTT